MLHMHDCMRATNEIHHTHSLELRCEACLSHDESDARVQSTNASAPGEFFVRAEYILSSGKFNSIRNGTDGYSNANFIGWSSNIEFGKWWIENLLLPRIYVR